MMAVGYGDVYPRTTQEMLYAILAQTVKNNFFSNLMSIYLKFSQIFILFFFLQY